MEKTLALILAGGQGRRMDILCHIRPKPALSFAGRYRVIDFSLSNCIHSGINCIAALADYLRSDMNHYINNWCQSNLNICSVDVLMPAIDSYKGTADAVYQNIEYLEYKGNTEVLILAGDHVYKMDYQRMIDYHEKTNADVTVGVIRVPFNEVYRFGTVKIDLEGRITEFVEKSPYSKSNLASMGIYVFNKNILIKRLTEDTLNNESSHDFGYSIIPKMVNHDRVFAFEYSGYWQDIGTLESYYLANMELLGKKPGFSLNSNWPIFTSKVNLSVQKGNKKGKIINSIVSPGCVIEGYVENSVLAPGVHVGENAKVIDSIVMSNSNIDYRSVIDKCILDENVDIGKYCYLGFERSVSLNKSDITVVGKNAVVPSSTTIYSNCKVYPEVKPEDFQGRKILTGNDIIVPIRKESVIEAEVL